MPSDADGVHAIAWCVLPAITAEEQIKALVVFMIRWYGWMENEMFCERWRRENF